MEQGLAEASESRPELEARTICLGANGRKHAEGAIDRVGRQNRTRRRRTRRTRRRTRRCNSC